MQKCGLSQESLKLIACITMLLDHIGAIIVIESIGNTTGASRVFLLDLYDILRTVGRLSFPIYCFLLVEGTFHTGNPKRYGLRLLICAVLAEIPFDLAFFGMISWQKQNVMVTLLLGFLMVDAMKKYPKLLPNMLIIAIFSLLADVLNADYEKKGILTIALFFLTRHLPHRALWQFLGLWFILSPGHLMALNWMKKFSVAMQEWATLSVVPIALYGGRKATNRKIVQWAFYLFYPVHLLALYLI